MRSQIRLSEQRPKPVDYFAIIWNENAQLDYGVSIENPIQILEVKIN